MQSTHLDEIKAALWDQAVRHQTPMAVVAMNPCHIPPLAHRSLFVQTHLSLSCGRECKNVSSNQAGKRFFICEKTAPQTYT